MDDAHRLARAFQSINADVDRLNACTGNFWKFAEYVLTEDIDEDGRIRCYPEPRRFPHVVKLHNWLYTADRGILYKKSRGMFATTATLTYMLWECLRTFTDIDGRVWSGCLISKNEDDAKLLIRRVRDIYLRLPDWLKRPLEIDNAREIKIKGGGLIRGLHAKGEGPRQEGYTFGLMDELAFQENADRNWRALLARTKRVVGISTPNGSGNLFYNLVHGKIPGIDQLVLHYSEHPDRQPGTPKGDAWIAAKHAGMPEVDWLREFEGRFDVWAEDGWYTEDWRESCVVDRLDWDEKALITLGIDPGYNKAGAMISYVNENNQWCRMKEFLGENALTQDFVGNTFEYCKAAYPRAQYRLSADPACVQNKTLKDEGGANTDYDVITRLAKDILGQSLYPQFDRVLGRKRRDGHRMIRMQFKKRKDGLRGTLVDREGCPIWIEGVRGGYRMPENATAKQKELEEPNRTSDHVHILDGDRYPVMEFTKLEGEATYQRQDKKWVEPDIRYDESGYPRGIGR